MTINDNQMSNANPKIILGVTGGIAAYKSLEIVKFLRKKGADVQVYDLNTFSHEEMQQKENETSSFSADELITNTEFFSFFIPYSVSLTFETFSLIKLLKKF